MAFFATICACLPIKITFVIFQVLKHFAPAPELSAPVFSYPSAFGQTKPSIWTRYFYQVAVRTRKYSNLTINHLFSVDKINRSLLNALTNYTGDDR